MLVAVIGTSKWQRFSFLEAIFEIKSKSNVPKHRQSVTAISNGEAEFKSNVSPPRQT